MRVIEHFNRSQMAIMINCLVYFVFFKMRKFVRFHDYRHQFNRKLCNNQHVWRSSFEWWNFAIQQIVHKSSFISTLNYVFFLFLFFVLLINTGRTIWNHHSSIIRSSFIGDNENWNKNLLIRSFHRRKLQQPVWQKAYIFQITSAIFNLEQ